MIEVRGLTKRYGSTVAVDRLSFEVPPGAVTGFLDLNGSGKSTTMRIHQAVRREEEHRPPSRLASSWHASARTCSPSTTAVSRRSSRGPAYPTYGGTTCTASSSTTRASSRSFSQSAKNCQIN